MATSRLRARTLRCAARAVSAHAAGLASLERGRCASRSTCARSRITIRRAGRRLLRAAGAWVADGTVHDHFIQFTEGVIAARGARRRRARACAAGSSRRERATRVELALRARRAAGARACASGSPSATRLVLELDGRGRRRCGSRSTGTGASDERFVGLGARHGTQLRSGRPRRPARRRPPLHRARLPARDARGRAASRRATARRCRGCSRAAATAVWLETDAQRDALRPRRRARSRCRPARRPGRCALHLLCRSDAGGAAARALPAHRLPGAAARVGLRASGRAATSTSTRTTCSTTSTGFRRARHPARRDRDRLAVGDAIQHLGVQPAPVPRRARDDRGACATTACAPCVWVTPWVNLDSRDGQIPPEPESERLHREPAPNYAPAARGRPLRAASADGEPFVAQWWMGTGSPVDFTSPAAERWWREQAKRVLALGVEGIKADDGEGYYIPRRGALRRRPHAAPRRRGRYGGLLPALDAARARRGPSRQRRAVRAQRLDRPAGDRADLGRATRRRTSGRCACSWSRR